MFFSEMTTLHSPKYSILQKHSPKCLKRPFRPIVYPWDSPKFPPSFLIMFLCFVNTSCLDYTEYQISVVYLLIVYNLLCI